MFEVDLLLLVGPYLSPKTTRLWEISFCLTEALSLASHVQCAGSELSKCPMGKTGHTHGPQVPICHSSLLDFSFLQ